MTMLKSCSRCAKLHDINYQCYKGDRFKKKDTKANKFRRTSKWTKKSNEIRQRDKHLCRCCIANIYKTDYIYNYNKLSVHHIVPLEEDFSLRLEDDNLITLCDHHHQMAEDGIIPREILRLLTNPYCDLKVVQDMVTPIGIPPTFNTKKSGKC